MKGNPMNIQEKLEVLAMTPDDWSIYNSIVDADTYRRTVVMYQKREFARLPRCGNAFGTCVKYCGGHCTSKNWCRLQGK